MGCEVGAERYARGDSPARLKGAAMRSDRRDRRRDPGRTRQTRTRALPALPRYPFFDNGVDAWMAAVHFFVF